MKKAKFLGYILCILGYIAMIFLFITVQKPNMENISNNVEMLDQETFLMVENKLFSSYIYQVNEAGDIQKAFWESNPFLGAEKVIKGVSYDQGVYYLTEYRDASGYPIYEVWSLDAEWREATLIGRLEKEQDIFHVEFQVKGSVAYLTRLDDFEQMMYVDALNLKAETPTFESIMVQAYPQDKKARVLTIADIEFDGETLFALTTQGEVYRYAKNAVYGERMSELSEITALYRAKMGIMFASLNKGVQQIHDGQIHMVTENKENNIIDIDKDETAGVTSVFARNVEGEKQFSVYNQEASNSFVDFKTLFPVKVSLYLSGILLLTGILIAILLTAWLLSLYLKKQHKIALSLAVITFGINIAFIVVVCVWTFSTSLSYLQESRGISTNVYVAEEVVRLEEMIQLTDSDLEDFAHSEWYETAKAKLYDWATPDFVGNLITFRLELIHLGDEESSILFSQQHAFGNDIDRIYHKKILDYLKEAKGTSFWKSIAAPIDGLNYIYLLISDDMLNSPGEKSERFVWVARGELRDVPARAKVLWQKSVRMGILCGGLSSLFFLFFIFIMLRPVNKMRKSMEKVSLGIYDLPEVVFPDNEFGDMWIYLHKMCKALKVQRYASDNVLDSYQRFAPEHFQKLMGREKLQDIRVGDMVQTDGTMAMISMMEKADFLEASEKSKYMQYANALLEMIQRISNHYKGVLLTSGTDFTVVRQMLCGEESADLAIQYSLEVLHAFDGWDQGKRFLNPCVMLFSGDFLCGLAGSQRQAYPFITSKQAESLLEFDGLLKRLGVRIAITEESKCKLQNQYSLRFIGKLYRKEHVFHIYEILDAYTKAQMKVREETLPIFQDGLARFYQKDFYHARGCFSDIIKKNAEDEVAKWYLFACDAILKGEGKQYESSEGSFYIPES